MQLNLQAKRGDNEREERSTERGMVRIIRGLIGGYIDFHLCICKETEKREINTSSPTSTYAIQTDIIQISTK